MVCYPFAIKQRLTFPALNMFISLRSIFSKLPLGVSLLQFFGSDIPNQPQLPLQDVFIQQPEIPGKNGTQAYSLELGVGTASPDGFARK